MAAAADGAGAGGLEVVVFPWLAFGHMIPFLELSKRLAARGHAVAFVSTPRNLARLPPVPAHLSARIRFVALPLPAVEGLPEGAEVTSDLPPDKVELLKKAMDGLAGPLASFLADAVAAGRRPDWIILDFCDHWVPPIADQHKVPCAAFLIFHAASMAFIGPRWANDAHPRTKPEDFTVPPKWIPFPSTTVFLHHEARRMLADNFGENASGRSDTDRLWDVFERCRLTIHRSCRELEPGMFTLLSELLRKPAVPAGILLPGATDDRHEDDWQSSSGGVLRWLDDQPPKSVVYVALGSEAPLTLENIHELALGLELAGVRFLWALRRPADTNNKQELLPAGFEERTRARGLVCTGWVPQVKVLAHGATAAFLTHCDWGSTIESFAFGLPLVMLPFLTDTPMIARAMAERGIGVQVARDESDGSFDKHGVAEAVRRVMVDGQGKEVFATNAKKLKELVVDEGRQEQYIHELEEHLIRYKEARSSTSTS
ncbi:UDP-glycosyltransferase 91C1 [Aegilops tauschii subsp. strangulata]|uniref:Glycosyltransferase N-terminal domain-containing protein n=2 Tax=Aegilops tauschii TaxID=37682 RepID=A0A453QLC5_AEGTS|nr:UDP-glycosyltransferase 91C1 [Aegilops tauschii subsp. strangulata]